MNYKRKSKLLYLLLGYFFLGPSFNAGFSLLKALPRALQHPDFPLQGEYVGVLGEAKKEAGVQIIALGKGNFRLVLYRGGLPGQGWDGSQKSFFQGKRQGRQLKVVFGNPKQDGWILQGTKLTRYLGGKPVGIFKKILRRSPTLGMKPPKGAIVLFDGKSAENFVRGRMDEEGLLKQGTESKRKFSCDHIVHLEFRIPFMPDSRGQGRGNSGVYLQGRYEVQVLDSFGLEGRINECGAIYGVAPPKVNMCFPPMSWQTYDIQLTVARFDQNGKKISNARMTVYHNGVLVHDNVEIPRAWTVAAPRPYHDEKVPGPLYLQHHGSEVRYRNIWALELTGRKKISVKQLVESAKRRAQKRSSEVRSTIKELKEVLERVK